MKYIAFHSNQTCISECTIRTVRNPNIWNTHKRIVKHSIFETIGHSQRALNSLQNRYINHSIKCHKQISSLNSNQIIHSHLCHSLPLFFFSILLHCDSLTGTAQCNFEATNEQCIGKWIIWSERCLELFFYCANYYDNSIIFRTLNQFEVDISLRMLFFN